MKAKIYTRLSRDEDGQTSTADQERECRALGARLGATVIEVFPEEPGTSGYKKDVPRPVFDQLIASIGQGDIVLAWALDRLTRQGMEQAGTILRILEERGSRLVTVSDGVDTATDSSELNTGIRAIMAREESKKISQRVRRGKATGAREGRWNGGMRWYGYQTAADGVWRGPKAIDTTEAKVLHEIRERYVAGERFLYIAADLNSRGLRTALGAKWKAENIIRLVSNKRYAGICVHNGIEYKGNWPAIFTDAQLAEVEATRHSASRMKHWPTGPTGTRSYLLTGFIYCHCGNKMVGNKRTDNGQTRRYKCRKLDNYGQPIGCGRSYRVADPLELLVSEAVLYRLDTPALAQLLAPPKDEARVAELMQRQTTLKQRLDEVHHDYYGADDGLRISRQHFLSVKSDLEARLSEAERELANVMNSRVPVQLEVGRTIRQAWERGSLDWRRRLISLLVEKVIVNRSKSGGCATWNGWRFKPEDIEIRWLH